MSTTGAATGCSRPRPEITAMSSHQHRNRKRKAETSELVASDPTQAKSGEATPPAAVTAFPSAAATFATAGAAADVTAFPSAAATFPTAAAAVGATMTVGVSERFCVLLFKNTRESWLEALDLGRKHSCDLDSTVNVCGATAIFGLCTFNGVLWP